MQANEYQTAAARTIGTYDLASMRDHAMMGMVAEMGELFSLYQKVHQGHHFDHEHAKKELGDLLWMIAEYCTSMGWNLADIMTMNIEKLKARYPDGFDPEHSLHRKDDDL